MIRSSFCRCFAPIVRLIFTADIRGYGTKAFGLGTTLLPCGTIAPRRQVSPVLSGMRLLKAFMRSVFSLALTSIRSLAGSITESRVRVSMAVRRSKRSPRTSDRSEASAVAVRPAKCTGGQDSNVASSKVGRTDAQAHCSRRIRTNLSLTRSMRSHDRLSQSWA